MEKFTNNHVVSTGDLLKKILHFRSRLKAKNLMYINQLLHILASFIKVMQGNYGY